MTRQVFGRVAGWLLSVTAVAAAGFAAGRRSQLPPRAAEPGRGTYSHTHAGPTIEQVRRLGALAACRVEVADAQTTEIRGRTGGVRAVLVVKGDVLLAVDLERARFASLDHAARTALLVLPHPRPLSPRLDHDRSRVYAIDETGLWAVTPGGDAAKAAVLAAAHRDAERLVATAGSDAALLGRCRHDAERLLGAFFRATGWTVRVRWHG